MTATAHINLDALRNNVARLVETVSPVATFSSVIVAPGRTPPVRSETRPCSSPAGAGKAKIELNRIARKPLFI